MQGMLASLIRYPVYAGIMLTVLVWVAIVIVIRKGPLFTAKRRAGIVFAVTVGAPTLQLIAAPRTTTILGAVTTSGGVESLIGQATLAIVVVVALSFLVRKGASMNGPGWAVLLGIWGMAATLFVSGLFSPQPSTATFFLLFAAAVAAVVAGVRDWHTIVRWSLAATRIVTVGSLISAVVAPSWAFIAPGSTLDTAGGLQQSYDRTIFGIPRLIGLTPHPNVLAIIASAAFALEVAYRGGNRKLRLVGIAAAAACILLAQSNTAYVAVGASILVLMLTRRAGAWWVSGTALIAALVVFMVAPQRIIPSSLTSSDYLSTVSGRLQIWQFAIDEWHRHPWLGYGPNMWSPNYLSLNLPANMQQAVNAHNQFFETLSDSGVVGVFFLAVLVAALVAGGVRACRVDRGVSLAVTTTLLVNSLTETPLRPVSVMLIVPLIALTLTVAVVRQAPARVKIQPPVDVRLGVPRENVPGIQGS
jgi:O-antigen ligase